MGGGLASRSTAMAPGIPVALRCCPLVGECAGNMKLQRGVSTIAVFMLWLSWTQVRSARPACLCDGGAALVALPAVLRATAAVLPLLRPLTLLRQQVKVFGQTVVDMRTNGADFFALFQVLSGFCFGLGGGVVWSYVLYRVGWPVMWSGADLEEQYSAVKWAKNFMLFSLAVIVLALLTSYFSVVRAPAPAAAPAAHAAPATAAAPVAPAAAADPWAHRR